jgi:hypothetical protein
MISISRKEARTENMYFINHVYFFITLLIIISNALVSHDALTIMSLLGKSASGVHNATSVISNAFIVPMMIFLFGLTVHSHIHNTSSIDFIKERLLVLVKYFLLSALIIMPLAYYLKTSNNGSKGDFIQFLSKDYFNTWMVGPSWIFSTIFFFDLMIFAFTYIGKGLSRKLFNCASSTKIIKLFAIFFIVLFAVAVTTNAPLGEFHLIPNRYKDWSHIGPIWWQHNVLVTYFLIYTFSVSLGSSEKFISYIFAPKGELPSKWLHRLLETIIIYLAMRYIASIQSSIENDLLYHSLLSFLSVLLIFIASAAFIGILDKFTKRNSKALEFFSEHSLIIYTVHFLPLVFIKNYLNKFPGVGDFQKSYIIALFTFFVSLVLSCGIKKISCFQDHCE